ncbi:septum formation inhibitor Maf [Croceiramulus getboli]|nr:septum formation inhibitor Maf [Flavobacteriaceae bacterium YJPT1-3]
MKYTFLLLSVLFLSCQTNKEQHLAQQGVSKVSEALAPSAYEAEAELRSLSDEFKDYWFAGEAEISSYTLEQARYGELRKGTAVLIYVTEDFLPDQQVKADQQQDSNVPVLKLNSTKNFVTGIYPYSIMNSTFLPLSSEDHAIKVTNSIQEWCGQVYAQINNREQFEIQAHSYFEGEADQHYSLPKTILENELWTLLRVNPDELPTGTLEIIPNLEYLRLKHQKIQAYTAKVSHKPGVYTIDFPSLSRKLTLFYETTFPFGITGWEESFTSGFGPNAKQMTTTATRKERLKTPYWRQNGTADESLRTQLGLD